MTDSFFDSFHGLLPRHVWGGLFAGVLVSLGLAAAYVFGGGVELLGNGQFLLIDQYAFSVAALVGGLGIGGLFYWIYGDLSSTLAAVLGVVYGLKSGLVDVWVYVLMAKPMPKSLPWLENAVTGIVAENLGFSTVTPLVIGITVVTGFVLTVLLASVLVDFEAQVGGFEI